MTTSTIETRAGATLMDDVRAAAVMSETNIDVIVAATPENVTYVTGFSTEAARRNRRTQFYGVLPRAAKPSLIVPILELCVVMDDRPPVSRVATHGTFHLVASDDSALGEAERSWLELHESTSQSETPLDALVRELTALGLTDARIALDEQGFLPAIRHQLLSRLPHATFLDATEVLRRIRMVKTPVEIERLAAAAAVNEEALERLVARSAEGGSSAELAAEYRNFVTARGAVPGLWTCLGGERSSGFFRPDGTPFRAGDVVRFDLGCALGSYWCDFGRTLCVGRPSARLRERYAALREGYEVAVAKLVPGVRASEVFALAVQEIRGAGLPEFDRHHCGHGIGLEFYDPPMIAPGDATLLEEGMVINIEVPFYELGFGGLQIEDTFVITRTGVRPLTLASRDLIIT